ncbi:hypothetical protein B0T11DRAFT_324641 [Plectosphaerella cucumerina]|uniref:Uncharacterized protein n=1 Tax=Plectosphaerella cucumerina TaxID=40658 RepID=A0A8K0X995_9PEZI|nr:hypothetical protein B0T11DRAFT_324641 [Plectosphaerella cucumerina]
MHSLKFTSINDYRSSNEAQGRTLHCLDDDEHGVPRTDVQQKAAVEKLMDAILDFGNWPNQIPIDNPRAVEAICNAGQYQPEEKILRILGATTTVTIEKIEILTWALLDHAIKIKDGGIIVAPWDEDPEYEGFETFGHRMDAMAQGLKENKSLVKSLFIDSRFMTRYVLRPVKEKNMKVGNKAVNENKQALIKKGQRANQ